MTYNEFLNQFIQPISNFITWLSMVADNLIHNYFFLTFFGITIFISLFYLVFNFVKDYFVRRHNNIENYLNKYNDYKMFQNVRSDFMQKEPNLFYDNLYKDYVFKKSVQDLYHELNNPTQDERIFSRWYDKKTGIPLSKDEEKEINDILENF